MHDDDAASVAAVSGESDKAFYQWLEGVDRKLNVFYPLVLIAFGTTGNLITFYVYTRKCFRSTSFGFYYSCLGIFLINYREEWHIKSYRILGLEV